MAEAQRQPAGRAKETAADTRVPVDQLMATFINKPGFLLARIDQIANAVYAGLGDGETLAQAELLATLQAHGAAGDPTDQIGLARACGIDTSTTATILDNLEMTGLVARQEDEKDRRRSLPVLTHLGRQRMAGVDAAFAALQAQLVLGMDAQQQAQLLALLDIVTHAEDGPAPRWDRIASPIAQAPSTLCRRALQLSQATFASCVAPDAITLRQFSALVILDLHPGLSQVEYARIYGLDPSTCAIVLKKLAARGFLSTARSDEDRRKTLYATTPAGRSQIVRIQPLADQSGRRSMGDLSQDEIDALIPLLQIIVRRHSARLRFPGCMPWEDDV